MNQLPIPELAAFQHSEKLTHYIFQQIKNAGGNIRFSDFMNYSLYAPGLGYYTAGAHKLGKLGDFMTAPEISPLFAQSIAKQFYQVLTQLSSGNILELGAGSGAFAKDLLLELEKQNCLPEHYFILEISADLRDRQQHYLKKNCPHLLKKIQWIDTLPQEFKGIIFANEVIDAMPVHLFEMTTTGIQERSVITEIDHFAWKLTPSCTELENFLKNLHFPVGYQSEVNLTVKPWIQSLAECLHQGLILLIDYGYGRQEYYHPDRMQGTLSCFYRHYRHDNPFLYPGLQDITAHVDFTSVVESGVTNGLNFAGYTTQTYFLFACGLLEIAAAQKLDAIELYQQSQAIKKLTLPSEMGELIKVIGLTKNLDFSLIGFSLQDRSRDL